ncbi:MAG: dethiobiotin synthase [Polyangiaceae bacterium]|nr:dethiobiotin synthase [Polyangiaceae bacterium]
MRSFITGTGTGVGKTFVTRALTLALRRTGASVAALKPVETGCEGSEPRDARALALASGRPSLARAAGFYRAQAPLAPYAATLGGEAPPPPLAALVAAVRAAAGDTTDHLLIEGAGGPLVPYDAEHDLLDLALALELPLLLVAPDALGVLSHTLAAAHAVRARGANLQAIILNRMPAADASTASNARILRERLPDLTVYTFAPSADDDDTLVEAIIESGLVPTITDDTSR